MGKRRNWKMSLVAALMALGVTVTGIPMEYVHGETKEQAYDIYVAVDGSDTSGDGTVNNPYATINKARDAAREKQGTTSDPVQVYIGAGKYFINEPIYFTAEDSNVTYIGDGAVLSGAKTLDDLSWSSYTGNNRIKVADVEAGLGIDQLFIDGEQQILARYPNYDASQVLQGSTTQEDIKAHSVNWSNPVGGYIRALHNYKWGGNSYIITGKDTSALGLSYKWVGNNNRGSGMLVSAIMVENIFEELDSPGEWYYDNTNGKLYVYPKSGQSLDASTLVEGAVTEEILHVEGSQDGAQVTNLVFDGLILENTKRVMFTGEHIPLMRSDWCVVRSGALFIKDAEEVSFKNGIIRNIGGNAVFLSGHSKNILIDNNEIINIGASGVLAAGLPDSCREPSFWENPPGVEMKEGSYYIHKTSITDTTKGPAKEHYPREAVISNNHIQNVGIWEKQSSQVALSVAYKISILHNTLHEGPRAGINVGDGTFGGHEIAYNDVFDVQKETDDHGMFNSWGRDRFWSLGGFDTFGNNGAAKEPYSLLDVIDTIKIHDNRMHFGGRVDGGSTFGIDLDDGSTNYEIYNNLCLNMGIKLREGFHRTVYNNIFVNGQINLHCTYEDSYDVIERNIVIKGTPYSLAATDEGRFRVSEDIIDQNWFFDLGMTINYPDFWSRLGYDANSVNADPLFADPSSNDYTVTNTDVMEIVGFENFDMDQFGKPGCEYQSPVYEKTVPDGNVDVYEREEWMGATISALDYAIMSSTGAGGLDGVYMESVPEDSQAAAYGMKTGDVLKVLNGEEIGAKSGFVSKYDAIELGDIVNINIIRNQLQMELNYIKLEQSSMIIDDQSPLITYTGGYWEESTPDFNSGNAVNCIEKTMSYTQAGNNREQICVEVPFTGTQIEFFTRKESSAGDYKFTIKDSDDQIVQEKVCSAFDAQMLDAQSVFVSDVLPLGDYTLSVTSISGAYVIVDAFKVTSMSEIDADSIVVEPITITDQDVRVTELVSGKTLNIQIPVANNGAESVELAASAVISGNDGALETETIVKDSIALAANGKETMMFEIKTPEGSESRRLEVFVYNKETGQPYTYVYTIDGSSVSHKEVAILDAVGDEIHYTYTSDENLLTVAATGFAENEQAIIFVTDSAENTVAVRQAKADVRGQVKTAFILAEGTEGLLSVQITDEEGTKKNGTVEIIAGENIVNRSALEAAILSAEKIIEDESRYTEETWPRFEQAYHAAVDAMNDSSLGQTDIVQICNELTEAQEALVIYVKMPEGDNVALNAEATGSFASGWITQVYGAVNDGIVTVPAGADANANAWGTWGNTSASEYVQYNWKSTVEVTGFDLYIWDDNPNDPYIGIETPSSYVYEYLPEGSEEWTTLLTVTEGIVGGAAGELNRVALETPVRTSAIRVTLYKHMEDGATETNAGVGLTEWIVYGAQDEVKPPVVTLPYVDVAETDWFYDAVYYNYVAKTMTGMDDTHFGPYGQLSRAQFALILYRIEGEPEVETDKTFHDITGDEWYGSAVLWAVENGIVTGYQDGNYGPVDNITREQMAVMMYRYAGYLGKDVTNAGDYSDFKDSASVSEFAAEAMQWAVAKGIITGKENGTLIDPQGNTARAEAAAIIQRFME